MHCGNSPGNKICKCNRTSLSHWSSHFWNCFAEICDVQALWNSNCTNARLTDATEYHWSLGKTWEGWRASCREDKLYCKLCLSFLPEIKEVSFLYILGVNTGSHSQIPLGKTFWKRWGFHSPDLLLRHIIPVPARMRVQRLFSVLPTLFLSDGDLYWPPHGESAAAVLNNPW